MFYDRIVISGCTRFSVSGRDYIELKPKAKVQMILGTNGSGKSSLAALGFSPLPIDKKQMKKGGYWIKEGRHLGDKYRLEGHYKGNPVFTFIKNGEVLLEKGTISNYMDLVKIHLGMDKWLHELLIGKIKFTELGPQQRQDLFSKISKSDFTQAFTELSRYKKKLTYSSNVKKFLQGRINEEQTKLITSEVREQLEQKLVTDTQEYESLPQIPAPERDLSGVMDEVYPRLKANINKYLRLPPTTPEYDNDESLKEAELQSRLAVAAIEANMQTTQMALTELDQQRHVIEVAGKELEAKRQHCQHIRERLEQNRQSTVAVDTSYLQDAPGLGQLLTDVAMLSAALPSSENAPTQADLENEGRNIDNNLVQLRQYEEALQRYKEELTYYQKIEQVTCPNCSTTFAPGVDMSRVQTLQEAIEERTRAQYELGTYTSKLQSRYQEMENLLQPIESLKALRTQSQSQYPFFWAYLDSNGWLTNGKGLAQLTELYRRSLSVFVERQALERDYEAVRAVELQVDERRQHHDHLEQQLRQKRDELQHLKETREQSRSIQAALQNQQTQQTLEVQHYQQIVEDLQLLDEAMEYESRLLDKNYRDLRSSELLSSIANVRDTLTEQTHIAKQIEDFENQRDDHARRVKVLSSIVDALSPKTGLIAEQIALSVGSVLTGLNQLFDKIWGYPMEVRIGTIGENGLDYKFPLHDSTPNPRADVADGSDSMIEMVNRAITMMAYYSMDLKDLPLFLDEPGRTFDQEHRNNLIPLVRDLTDSSRFSQVIVISHEEDVQTAFPNSEVTIIDERNIKYPHAYNEHVTFTKPKG